MRRDAGFTLIEWLVAAGIFALFSAMLSEMLLNYHNVSRREQATISSRDQAWSGVLAITEELLQASNATISALPSSSISYQIPVDLDGNGTPLDSAMGLELGELRTITRDFEDANADGLKADQLVLISQGRVRVLANWLTPDEDLDHDGVLAPGEDATAGGVLNYGVRFAREGGGVRVVLEVRSAAEVGRFASASMSELVVPRN